MKIIAEDTMALVIDYQERLMPVMDRQEELLSNTVKLIKGLNVLNVPLIATQQYTKGLGMTVPEIQELFEAPFIYQDKTSFSCTGEPVILEAMKKQNKSNIIICGIEAHICVLQTVLDCLDLGYQVIVVEDCVSTRKQADKEIAMKRMSKEGAVITSCESLLFELTQKAGTEQFKEISRLVK